MKTSIFPECCGLNILSMFPKDEYWNSECQRQLDEIPTRINDFETGAYGIGYCALGGQSPYVRAHIIAVTDRQLKVKAVLEKLGYRVLGQFAGAHSSKNEGEKGFYRIYLLGKGFEKEIK